MNEADDVQFGRLERPFPRVAQRCEDRSGVACGCVGIRCGNELPVYIDLDTWLAMEQHASEDPSVELGGVLLGEPFEDPAGQPFLVVERALRAKHYRSTQGSFTFTHDTWAQITQDKDQLAPSSRIVGWYHTHPGWGIFLSSADLFICQHYFNSPMDIAVVIDPRHMQYGVFCWQGHRMTQVNGFYLTTSASRLTELEQAVQRASNMGVGKERLSVEMRAAAYTPHQNRSDRWSGFARWLAVGLFLCLVLQITCVVGSLMLAWKVSVAVTTLAQQHQALIARLDQTLPAPSPDNFPSQGEGSETASESKPTSPSTQDLTLLAEDDAATDVSAPSSSQSLLSAVSNWLPRLTVSPLLLAAGVLGMFLAVLAVWQIVRLAAIRRTQRIVYKDEEPVGPL